MSNQNDNLIDELLRAASSDELLSVSGKLTAVPIKTPNRHHFIRVRPEPEYSRILTLFEDKREGSTLYIIDPSLAPYFEDELHKRIMVTAVHGDNNLFIWPLRLDEEGKRPSEWNKSARNAMEEAKSKWVRVFSDKKAKQYKIAIAEDKLPDPTWPEETFEEILRMAFGDFVISDEKHPVIKALKGRI